MKLYVGNLSFDSTEETVRAAFEADGREVLEVALITDRDTGRPRGFGFVTMGSTEAGNAAIQALDGTELDGRTITVNQAREKKSGSGGRRGGNRW